MPGEKILILGGTGEARALATALVEAGYHVTTSLAGVTTSPQRPDGRVRRGGFGGAEGLRRYLAQESYRAVVDATHPFAVQMSAHAKIAAEVVGIPILRIERPAWAPGDGDAWWTVASAQEAADVLPYDARPLVTIGQKDIDVFLARDDLAGVARMIEPPPQPVPENWTLVLERPPFTLEGERGLIRSHEITHLVSKNAGGQDTAAKLAAAREEGIPVVMIERPRKPRVPSFPEVNQIISALGQVLLP